MANLNIQVKPVNFENIIASAIATLQMMYPRWANAPEMLSSGVHRQIAKMVYSRFENSKIEHITEQVARMRRQWGLYPREDTAGLEATNAIHSEHELSHPGGSPKADNEQNPSPAFEAAIISLRESYVTVGQATKRAMKEKNKAEERLSKLKKEMKERDAELRSQLESDYQAVLDKRFPK